MQNWKANSQYSLLLVSFADMLLARTSHRAKPRVQVGEDYAGVSAWRWDFLLAVDVMLSHQSGVLPGTLFEME